jgi:hypothetical protein
MLRELRLDLHPSLESVGTLGPMIDPNIHSCGTVPPHGEAELRHPEANFYIVGMKSYGRAPRGKIEIAHHVLRHDGRCGTELRPQRKADQAEALPGKCHVEHILGGKRMTGLVTSLAAFPRTLAS